MKILFVSLSKEVKTGARYTENIMRRALSRRHEVRFLYPHRNFFPFFGYLPLILKKSYELILTSDNFVFADVVYVQPPAGGDISLTPDEMLNGRGLSQFTFLWLQKPLYKVMLPRARFITNSNYARGIVKKLFHKDASVLYPPVPTHLYSPPSHGDRDNLVVTISTLNPRKNLSLIAEVGKMVPQAKFILIGYRHERFEWILKDLEAEFERAGLGGNFIYVPSALDVVKGEILSKAKVYFHPALYEPFGISIVEGMAAGCIPVVHDSGGPKEFVPDEQRCQDAEGMASKIRQALKSWNIEQAARFRSVALQFSEERFEEETLEIIESYRPECGKINPEWLQK